MSRRRLPTRLARVSHIGADGSPDAASIEREITRLATELDEARNYVGNNCLNMFGVLFVVEHPGRWVRLGDLDPSHTPLTAEEEQVVNAFSVVSVQSVMWGFTNKEEAEKICAALVDYFAIRDIAQAQKKSFVCSLLEARPLIKPSDLRIILK